MRVVKDRISGGILSFVAAVALAGAASTVAAQQSDTVPPPPAPTTSTPPAKAKAKTAATTKTPSACKGLEEKPCRGNTTCVWIAASVGKDGKPNKAYCRSKPRAGKPKCKGLEQAACAA